MFVPGRPLLPNQMFVGKAMNVPQIEAPERCFHSSLMFVGKARSLPNNGASERWSTKYTRKHYKRLGKQAGDKHYSLL
jgi:hypothetical protein